MLNKPESSKSTFWEGYHKDGSFAYQGIYMSNAHGWATGPAAALTYNTLGIRPAPSSADSVEYVVAPRFGGLAHCEGRLTFAPGAFVGAAWVVKKTNSADSVDSVTLTVDSSTMMAVSTGTITIINSDLDDSRKVEADGAHKPLSTVTLNGELVWDHHQGALCNTRELCGLRTSVGTISVRGVTGSSSSSSGVVQVGGVQPQHSLELVLSF
jgi:hypothetical protein